MKKNITILLISFFILVSCSSEDNNTEPPVLPEAIVDPVVSVPPGVPTATKAILNGNVINVSWAVVAGTGITYNVYRNDNPVKINTAPLSEPKFTDVLTATGSFTYTVTATSGSLESAKGAVSDKVVLELPKTKTVETTTTNFNTKTETTYNYDTVNITKLVSETIKKTQTRLKDQTVTITNTIGKHTYDGDLIEKIIYSDVATDALVSSITYTYNDKKKLTLVVRGKSDGTVNYITTYVYNSDGTTTETNTLPGGESWVFTLENNNLVKYVYSILKDGTVNYIEEATSVYDTKEYIYKNVFGYMYFFGTSTSYNNQLSSSIVVKEDGNVVANQLFKAEYTYNENGFVLTKNKYNASQATPVLIETTTYTY